MIIDLILDRKAGAEYIQEEFYNNVADYGITWPGLAEPILEAMNHGTEKDVKKALCHYIEEAGYNMDICKYINSVEWIY